MLIMPKTVSTPIRSSSLKSASATVILFVIRYEYSRGAAKYCSHGLQPWLRSNVAPRLIRVMHIPTKTLHNRIKLLWLLDITEMAGIGNDFQFQTTGNLVP